MEVVVLGVSHHTAPVEVRERLAISERNHSQALDELRKLPSISEVVIVSTCNRTELYAATGDADLAMQDLHKFLSGFCNVPQIESAWLYKHKMPKCVDHLFNVVSGLDSMIVGETEILGQVKQAYESAFKHKSTGKFLNQLFQKAFSVAKHVRTNTNITRGSVSVASAAVELAEKIFGTLSKNNVMILGAGDTSEKTAKALRTRGVRSILVSNRTFEHAERLARELDGRAIHFDWWENECSEIDIIISSTSAPHYIITVERLKSLMKLRKYRPLFLIDIAVPRDIEPEVNRIENVYLYNIDDLQAIADMCLHARRKEVERCRQIIRVEVEQFQRRPQPPHDRTYQEGKDWQKANG